MSSFPVPGPVIRFTVDAPGLAAASATNFAPRREGVWPSSEWTLTNCIRFDCQGCSESGESYLRTSSPSCGGIQSIGCVPP